METSYRGLSVPSLSLSTHCPAVSVCSSALLLQEEASVMTVSKTVIYEYSRVPLGVILLLVSLV